MSYIVAPFIALALFLWGLNFWPQAPTSETAVFADPIPPIAPETNQLSGTLQPTATPFPTVTPLPTASPTSLPTSTPYVAPAFAPDTIISLLGPPANSAFQSSNAVTFYWEWPLPLMEDQRLTLYLQVGGEIRPFAVLTEPNLGASYRATIQLNDEIAASSPVQWQIRLESAFANAPLSVSETRSLIVIDNP